VVISGDLTQRAKAREFRAAVDLMRRLPAVPTIVTPGNHDVPVYRVLERAFAPYRRWRAGVSPDLDTVTRVDGATFVALNSTAPWRTVVGGRIDAWQVEYAREAFARCEPGEVRALVIHHHFVPTPDGTGGRPLPRAARLVRSFESMDVDFVLGGHVHRTHVRTSRDLVRGAGEGMPLVACGTTTSRRGRGPEQGVNSLNVLRVSPRGLEVLPHVLRADAEEFVPAKPIMLRLGRAAELARGARAR
jgi:3',5'-cyclic AMP phosphodiesterase CpdA